MTAGARRSVQCLDRVAMRACERLRAGLPGGLRVATARAVAPEAVAALVSDVNFFRNKARHIVACADAIASRHAGRVPAAFAALTALPGVGPKIANLVLSVDHPQPRVCVCVCARACVLSVAHPSKPIHPPPCVCE
jgi:endonuclease III